MNKILLLFLPVLLMYACADNNPNLNKKGKDVLKQKEIFIGDVDLPYNDTIYVPIYSDIYSETKDTRFYLTATLSIRNTSLRDSIFIREIDYYDTDGNFVRDYIAQTLLLKPMQSIEYVIDKDDRVGGAGANFIIIWGSYNPKLTPVFQGVMISTNGQQGISFLTEGVSISGQ